MGAESGGKRTSYLGLACEIYLCLKYQLCYYIVKLSQFFFNTSTITVFLENSIRTICVTVQYHEALTTVTVG